MDAILKSLVLFAILIGGVPFVLADFEVARAHFDTEAATKEKLRSLRNNETWFTECASD